MPWNEPGDKDDNQKDPWGGKRGQNPPDLDKILGGILRKLREIMKGTQKKVPSSFQPSHFKEYQYGAGILLGLILILWFISGLFIVNPAEEAVILRLGKYETTMQPGLHWYARFIDTKYLVDVQKIYSFSLQGDFLTKSSDQNDMPSAYIQLSSKKVPGSLDQSKNLVNVELNVQYRINDPDAYLFNVVNPDDTIQQVASGALSDVIGTMKLDEVLTTGRELVSSGVFERTKQVLNNYRSGLEVIAVTLRKVQAPDQVQAAFNDVNRAEQDRATYIQQAQAYASKVVPLAQGNAARTLADATGYQQQVVLTAQANVARYQALLKAYLGAPDVTRERMYLDTMQTVLQNTTKILVDVSGNNLLYLPLDKLLKQDLNDKESFTQNGSMNTIRSQPSMAGEENK
ncbi:MAG: Protease subunit HflK [uncultured bacterium]|nr:MAG: Protease subunit HflK [uncultured bacterium]